MPHSGSTTARTWIIDEAFGPPFSLPSPWPALHPGARVLLSEPKSSHTARLLSSFPCLLASLQDQPKGLLWPRRLHVIGLISLLSPYWLLCCSQTWRPCPGLCTCCSLCLKCCFPTYMLPSHLSLNATSLARSSLIAESKILPSPILFFFLLSI